MRGIKVVASAVALLAIAFTLGGCPKMGTKMGEAQAASGHRKRDSEGARSSLAPSFFWAPATRGGRLLAGKKEHEGCHENDAQHDDDAVDGKHERHAAGFHRTFFRSGLKSFGKAAPAPQSPVN